MMTTTAWLKVSNGSKLTDEAMKAVAAGCSSLTALDVAHCKNLTDEAKKAVAAGCASLTVSYCSKLTDKSIKAFEACVSLSSFELMSLSLEKNKYGGKISFRAVDTRK